jgi:hypothetical protein
MMLCHIVPWNVGHRSPKTVDIVKGKQHTRYPISAADEHHIACLLELLADV